MLQEDKEFLREKPSTKGGGKRKQKVRQGFAVPGESTGRAVAAVWPQGQRFCQAAFFPFAKLLFPLP